MTTKSLSDAQKKVLLTLSKPYVHRAHGIYPRDAFNSRTLDALKNRGLVVYCSVQGYLGSMGGVKLTAEGKAVLKALLNEFKSKN